MENGYYHGVYSMIRFNKEYSVDRKEEQADVDQYHYEGGMKGVKLDDERESFWRMVFEDNGGGGGR